ncbi:MAG: hypothetical protein DWQ04_25370 [Chloroflexi bacterium]|nr:MAG: hypothetical protein DWQ04_25370 [Chloroflexota bacterium]
MITRIRTFFAPPIFEDDEEKTRIARLLNIILITVMALVMVFSVPALWMTPEFGRVLIELVLAGWAFVMLILLRRGYVRLAGFLFSLTLWAVVSYGTYEAGGFRGSTMSAYFGIILIAELLLGAWSGAIIGILSIIVTGWMLIASGRGWFPPAAEYATLTTFWVEFSTVVVGVVALTSLVINSLKKALARARHNEKELAKKVKEVEILANKAIEANEFKTQLIARVSHELRTPLGAIMGMSEMLQQEIYGPMPPAQKEVTERIVNNSQALEYVFAELLDQSQIDSGQLVLKKDFYSIRQIIETVHNNNLMKAQNKGLSIKVEIDPNLPTIMVGDARRIEQIVSNLAINAIKFTKSGHILISSCYVDNEHWALRVVDTGIGIPEDMKPHIFEPFRQADESIKREYGGVGLGLSIVKQLVTAMNGSMKIESTVGKGSSFTVVFPLQTAVSEIEGQ